MVCGSACMGEEGLRRWKIVLGVCIRGLEKEVGRGDVRAAATTLFARKRRRPQPAAEGVSCNRNVAAVKQRVVERIVDELRELLGERLNVAVFDDCGGAVEIRTEHEGIPSGGVDSVRSPRTAECRITFGVVGGVAGHGDDE